MKKTLKEHRKTHNLSQQELSEKSGISVRTIQRIEKGGSTGSPFIIKSLCKTLDIDAADLEIELDSTAPEQNEQLDFSPQRRVKAINLSAIFVVFLPLLNLVLPTLLFFVYKKQMTDKVTVLKILSFQILWTLLTLLLCVMLPFLLAPRMSDSNAIRFWVYFICVVLNVFVVLNTAIKLSKSQPILAFVPNIL